MDTQTEVVHPVVKKVYDGGSSLQELVEGIGIRCKPLYKAKLTVVLENDRAVLKGWPEAADDIMWVEPLDGNTVRYHVREEPSGSDLIEKIIESELDRFTAATGATFVLELAA